MNIYLIGYRCSGKTSAGRCLAAKLGWPLVDADAEVVAACGMSIKEIVRQEGWDGFRKRERAVVERLCRRDRHVVATGGGAVLDKANVKDMQASGVLVWLRATPETVKERIVRDHHTDALRPALTGRGFLEEIDELLLSRIPYYEKAMDFCVDTDGTGIDDICSTIIRKLKGMGRI